MLRLVAADCLKIRRYWLAQALLIGLLVLTALQVNGRLNALVELEEQLALQLPAGAEQSQFDALIAETARFEFQQLKADLSYPRFVGYSVRLASQFGWFLLILLSAVMGGEDFSRRTLRVILARSPGRWGYLAAHCLALWLASGLAILLIALLAAIAGPFLHARVSEAPLALAGLGQALLSVLRAWIAGLPFIAVTLFWVVLGRSAGPALGVGIGLHAFEAINGLLLPALALVVARGAAMPGIYQWQARLYSLMLGFNAEVFMHWGSPFSVDLGDNKLLPTDPWRAAAFLLGYTFVFLGWASWVLSRRDITYES